MSDNAEPYTLKEVDAESEKHLFSDFDSMYPHVLARLRATVEALEKAQEEAANWHSAFQQKAYPAESCRKERDDGNGGCGACAICCHEATQRAEKAEADVEEFRRLQQVWLMSPEAAKRLVRRRPRGRLPNRLCYWRQVVCLRSRDADDWREGAPREEAEVSAHYYWRQAGTTGRAHLVMRLDSVQGTTYPASMSECGMVRFAAWAPIGRASKCGLCRRLEALRKARHLPAVVKK